MARKRYSILPLEERIVLDGSITFTAINPSVLDNHAGGVALAEFHVDGTVDSFSISGDLAALNPTNPQFTAISKNNDFNLFYTLPAISTVGPINYTIQINQDIYSGTLQVNETPVVLSGSGDLGAIHAANFSGVVATFVDDGELESGDLNTIYAATIDWGDSSTTAGTVSLISGNTFSVLGSHSYSASGSYAITAHISHEGTFSSTKPNQISLVVDLPPLQLTLDAPTLFVGEAKNSVTLGHFTTSNPTDSYSAIIHWSDGRADTTANIVQGSDPNSFLIQQDFPATFAVGSTRYDIHLTDNTLNSTFDATSGILTVRYPGYYYIQGSVPDQLVINAFQSLNPLETSSDITFTSTFTGGTLHLQDDPSVPHQIDIIGTGLSSLTVGHYEVTLNLTQDGQTFQVTNSIDVYDPLVFTPSNVSNVLVQENTGTFPLNFGLLHAQEGSIKDFHFLNATGALLPGALSFTSPSKDTFALTVGLDTTVVGDYSFDFQLTDISNNIITQHYSGTIGDFPVTFSVASPTIVEGNLDQSNVLLVTLHDNNGTPSINDFSNLSVNLKGISLTNFSIIPVSGSSSDFQVVVDIPSSDIRDPGNFGFNISFDFNSSTAGTLNKSINGTFSVLDANITYGPSVFATIVTNNTSVPDVVIASFKSDNPLETASSGDFLITSNFSGGHLFLRDGLNGMIEVVATDLTGIAAGHYVISVNVAQDKPQEQRFDLSGLITVLAPTDLVQQNVSNVEIVEGSLTSGYPTYYLDLGILNDPSGAFASLNAPPSPNPSVLVSSAYLDNVLGGVTSGPIFFQSIPTGGYHLFAAVDTNLVEAYAFDLELVNIVGDKSTFHYSGAVVAAPIDNLAIDAIQFKAGDTPGSTVIAKFRSENVNRVASDFVINSSNFDINKLSLVDNLGTIEVVADLSDPLVAGKFDISVDISELGPLAQSVKDFTVNGSFSVFDPPVITPIVTSLTLQESRDPYQFDLGRVVIGDGLNYNATNQNNVVAGVLGALNFVEDPLAKGSYEVFVTLTPNYVGVVDFDLQVETSLGDIALQHYTLTIENPPIDISLPTISYYQGDIISAPVTLATFHDHNLTDFTSDFTVSGKIFNLDLSQESILFDIRVVALGTPGDYAIVTNNIPSFYQTAGNYHYHIILSNDNQDINIDQGVIHILNAPITVTAVNSHIVEGVAKDNITLAEFSTAYFDEPYGSFSAAVHFDQVNGQTIFPDNPATLIFINGDHDGKYLLMANFPLTNYVGPVGYTVEIFNDGDTFSVHGTIVVDDANIVILPSETHFYLNGQVSATPVVLATFISGNPNEVVATDYSVTSDFTGGHVYLQDGPSGSGYVYVMADSFTNLSVGDYKIHITVKQDLPAEPDINLLGEIAVLNPLTFTPRDTIGVQLVEQPFFYVGDINAPLIGIQSISILNLDTTIEPGSTSKAINGTSVYVPFSDLSTSTYKVVPISDSIQALYIPLNSDFHGLYAFEVGIRDQFGGIIRQQYFGSIIDAPIVIDSNSGSALNGNNTNEAVVATFHSENPDESVANGDFSIVSTDFKNGNLFLRDGANGVIEVVANSFKNLVQGDYNFNITVGQNTSDEASFTINSSLHVVVPVIIPTVKIGGDIIPEINQTINLMVIQGFDAMMNNQFFKLSDKGQFLDSFDKNFKQNNANGGFEESLKKLNLSKGGGSDFYLNKVKFNEEAKPQQHNSQSTLFDSVVLNQKQDSSEEENQKEKEAMMVKEMLLRPVKNNSTEKNAPQIKVRSTNTKADIKEDEIIGLSSEWMVFDSEWLSYLKLTF